MLPEQPGSPFGPSNGGNGMFPGGGPGNFGGPGGPPPADAMFENFLGDEDELLVDPPTQTRENEILDAGLQFFDKIKKMK